MLSHSQESFNPKTLSTLQLVFDDLIAEVIKTHQLTESRIEIMHDILARCIVDAARRGFSETDHLRMEALLAFEKQVARLG